MSNIPGADDLDLELLPEEDILEPEDDVEAAVASALAPDFVSLPGSPPIPFGKTWRFNWETGRFRRYGAAPAEARGTDALIEWVQTALHSGRFAHGIFDDDFGVEDQEEPVGLPASTDDLEERIRRALLQHERIADVEMDIVGDPAAGEVAIRYLDIVTDDEDRVNVIGDSSG